ncbi:MAG: hypothetical protein WC557_09770 [Ignavibacteriaceae bacterium]
MKKLKSIFKWRGRKKAPAYHFLKRIFLHISSTQVTYSPYAELET